VSRTEQLGGDAPRRRGGERVDTDRRGDQRAPEQPRQPRHHPAIAEHARDSPAAELVLDH